MTRTTTAKTPSRPRLSATRKTRTLVNDLVKEGDMSPPRRRTTRSTKEKEKATTPRAPLAPVDQVPSSDIEPDTIYDDDEEPAAAGPPPPDSSSSSSSSSESEDSASDASSSIGDMDGLENANAFEQDEHAPLGGAGLAEELFGDLGPAEDGEQEEGDRDADLDEFRLGDRDEEGSEGGWIGGPEPMPQVTRFDAERELRAFDKDPKDRPTEDYVLYRNLPHDQARNFKAYVMFDLWHRMKAGPSTGAWDVPVATKTSIGQQCKIALITVPLLNHTKKDIVPLFEELLITTDIRTSHEIKNDATKKARFEEVVSTKWSDAKHAFVTTLHYHSSDSLDAFIDAYLGNTRFVPCVAQATVMAALRDIASRLGNADGTRIWTQIDHELATFMADCNTKKLSAALRYDAMYQKYYRSTAAKAPASAKWRSGDLLPTNVLEVISAIRTKKPEAVFRFRP